MPKLDFPPEAYEELRERPDYVELVEEARNLVRKVCKRQLPEEEETHLAEEGALVAICITEPEVFHEWKPFNNTDPVDLRAVMKEMDPHWTGAKPSFANRVRAIGPDGENLLDSLIAEGNTDEGTQEGIKPDVGENGWPVGYFDSEPVGDGFTVPKRDQAAGRGDLQDPPSAGGRG